MVKWILRSSNIGYSSCCVSFRRRSYLFGIRKIEDFNNRLDDAESEQSKDELNLETKKLIDAEWIRPSG